MTEAERGSFTLYSASTARNKLSLSVSSDDESLCIECSLLIKEHNTSRRSSQETTPFESMSFSRRDEYEHITKDARSKRKRKRTSRRARANGRSTNKRRNNIYVYIEVFYVTKANSFALFCTLLSRAAPFVRHRRPMPTLETTPRRSLAHTEQTTR